MRKKSKENFEIIKFLLRLIGLTTIIIILYYSFSPYQKCVRENKFYGLGSETCFEKKYNQRIQW